MQNLMALAIMHFAYFEISLVTIKVYQNVDSSFQRQLGGYNDVRWYLLDTANGKVVFHILVLDKIDLFVPGWIKNPEWNSVIGWCSFS